MLNFLTNRINNKKGFTLVESLVAISVLLIGVLGPLVLATTSISDGISTKNKIAASYLAQEGMELVLATREINAIAGDWLKDFDRCTGSGCNLEDDMGNNTISINSCSVITNCEISLGNGPTFTRKIFINDETPGKMISVRTEVTWSEKGVAKGPYELKSFLFYQGE